MAADVKPVAVSLPERMRTSLLGYWHDAHPWQRFASLVGSTLIAVGLAHLVAWLVVGGAWADPVSFRKPTTFGISFGLTTVTLAWVAGHLRISDRTGWLLVGPLAVADTAEVVSVSLQRWRGVAAYFNDDTTLDSMLFLFMGGGALTVEVICSHSTGSARFRRAARLQYARVRRRRARGLVRPHR